MVRARVVWGGVAVALLTAVLALVGPPGPAAAVEPGAIVPTGVAAPVRGLSCPTDDVCWSAGLEEAEGGALIGVVHRIVDGVQGPSMPIPVGSGGTASPEAIDCWSATDCAVMADVTTAEDPDGHLAVSYVLGGVPTAPEGIVVPGAEDPGVGVMTCHGPVCEVAGIDLGAPIFTVFGFVATVSPGVATVVDELPDTTINDIECVGDTCGVVGWRGDPFDPEGYLGLRGPGGLVDVQETDVIIDGVECEAVMSCIYTTVTPSDGLSVGRITPGGGVQPPTLVPGFLGQAFDLSCGGAGIDACVAVGHDLEHGATVLVEDAVPAERSVIEELRVLTAVECGDTSCIALGYSAVGEAGLEPAHARLLTGLALPAEPVETRLQVDPAILELRVLNPKLSVGTVSARLVTADGLPLSGKPVAFSAAGAPVCTALTDADGRATCSTGLAGLLRVVLGGGVTAGFAGDDTALPSEGSAGLIG